MDDERHECQICGRQIKAKNGKIAHHGYERPGWGYQTASCAGARHVPYSKGHDALDQQLQWVPEAIVRQEEALKNWIASPPDEIAERQPAWQRHNPPRKFPRPEGFDGAREAKQSGSRGYQGEFVARVWEMQGNLKGLRNYRDFIQKRRDEWKPEA